MKLPAILSSPADRDFTAAVVGGLKPSLFFALQPTHSISKSDGFGTGLSSLVVCLHTLFTCDNQELEKGV